MINGLLTALCVLAFLSYIAGVLYTGNKVYDKTDSVGLSWIFIMFFLFGVPLSIIVGAST